MDDSSLLKVLLGIVLMVAVCWCIATLLFAKERTVMRIAGPVLLVVGLAVALLSLTQSSTAGLIMGGLLAVVGAILCLKK